MNTRHHMLCSKFTSYSQLIVKLVPISYFLGTTTFSCAVVIESIWAGRLKPSLLLYMPSIDDDDKLNIDTPIFVANIAFQMCALIVLSTCDAIIHLTFLNVPLLATIIVADIAESEGKLNKGPVNRIAVKRHLVAIIRKHKEYKE